MRRFSFSRAHGAVFAILAGVATAAGAGEVSLGVAASTLGVGAEVGYSFNDHLALRGGGYAFSYSDNGEEGGIEYDGDLELRSGGLFLDWHPFGGSFTLTGGVLANGNEVDATGEPGPGDIYDIGGITFTSAEVGRLGAEADFDSVAPYLGVGWRSRGGEDGGFGVSIDLGVLFQGSPDVSLDSSGGTLSGDSNLQQALRQEENELEDDLDDYEFYPVLALGLSYTF
jgi:hypothetical protein